MSKRLFIKRATVLGAGLLAFCYASPLAFAAAAKMKLSAKLQQSSLRPGFRSRLNRIRITKIEDAFRLANRKTEIQVNLS